jgi:hypothetical protein
VQIGEGHELTQEVSISDMKYSNPDFDITREWVYVHTDTIDGNGRLNAYFVDFAEDGVKHMEQLREPLRRPSIPTVRGKPTGKEHINISAALESSRT